MREFLFYILIGIMPAAALSSAALPDCPDLVISISSETSVRFKAHLADDQETRALGLMGVDYLPPDQAMLFDFGHETNVGLWMKNTLIPLDMIFISEAGVVSSIHENAIPHDLTTITSGSPVRYVLEINGGQSRHLGLKSGQQVSATRSDRQCAEHQD